jgi:protein tyrosine phosphatase (PTP) superfamily phosphohydrolase (DUF442 family)
MDTIYRGDLVSKAGRRNAWMDALFVDHAVLRLGWTNFATVQPGVLYRANHPLPGHLRRYVQAVGLRSVINLRGQCANGSDALSREAAGRLGLEFYDMALESRGAPQRVRIMRLAEIYRTMARPGLIHCKSGADRAGLAAALYVLIEGGSSAQALAQLSWRFGHIKQSNTGILDAFIATYAREAEGRVGFLDWVEHMYDETDLRARFRSRSLARFVNDRILRRE